MAKVSTYAEASTIAEDDKLVGTDVSDTSMAATGTTKEFAWSLIRDTLGIVAQPTRTSLGTSYTPSQLTMRAVHLERSRDPLPASGPHTPLVEEFMTSDLFTSRYDLTVGSGTMNTQTVDQGVLTAGSTAGADVLYRGRTKIAVPTGVFTSVRVEPGWSGTGFVCCGFYTSSTSADFVQAQWELSTGAIDISNGSPVNTVASTGTPDTIAGPTTSTGPLWLGLLLAWPSAMVMTSKDGRNWDVQKVRDMSRSTDLTVASAWSSFRPGFRMIPGSSSSLKISKFCAGYAGSYGFRDQKPVTFADGTPFRKDGKYYVTGTVAHGSNSFRTNHMAVYSFDPVTYQTDLVTHLFYDLTGTGVGAGYGGQAVYDEDTGQWSILANSWGFDDQATGVDLILATTYRDITEPGVLVLKASRLTGISSNSLYDCTLRKDGSTWKVAAIETTSRTNWAADQVPVLLTGSSLTGLTKTVTDTTAGVDGTCWTKIGGNWYVTGAGPSSFLAWDANLANKSTLTSWSSALPANLVTFSTFPAHAGTLVVDDGHQTRYVVITYDASLILRSASRGGLIVLEADEKPTGQEHAPKIVPRFYGT